MLTIQERQDYLQQYNNGMDELRATLAKIPKDAWQFKPTPTAWSIHEILIHLPDSETNSFGRIRAAIATPNVTIFAYDQDAWASHLWYHEQNTDDALDLLALIRKMTYALLQKLPIDSAAWSQTIDHPENGIMSLDDLLVSYATHIPDHIEQIHANVAAWKAKNTG